MTITQADGFFLVKLGTRCVGDFASREAAEKYIRSRGYIVR